MGFVWATLIFSLFSVWRYFGPVFYPAAGSALLLVLTGLAAAGAGRAALERLGLGDFGESEKTLAGATLGLGLLSLGTFALGALHLLYPWAAALLLAAFLVYGRAQARQAVSALFQAPPRAEFPLAAGLLFLTLALLFWTTWVPPHQYDSLVYHLALPQAYVRAGKIFTVPQLLYSHFPQNGEMLFTLALLLGSDVLAQMFSWLALALGAWWVYEAGKEDLPKPAAWLACLLLATHTAVMLLAATSYVETLVMLWITAAALVFFRSRKAQARSRPALILSALFSGLALGTKYYAGISAALLFAFLALEWERAPRGEGRERARDLGVFTAVVTAVFLPWLIKNALSVGNPVFPFFYQWFPMTGTGWNAETARRYFEVFTEYGHRGRYFKDILSLPMLLLKNSLRFGGGMDVLGDLGWELVFWCLPLAVWAGWKDRFMRRLLAFCGAYLTVWFFTGVVLRFLVVLAPLLCLLAACGLYRLWQTLSERGRWGLAAGVSILTATHFLLFFYVHGVFGSERFLLGLEDRPRFLRSRLDYYACAEFAREHLPINDKILIVGEQRGYYVAQEHAATTVHAPNPFIAWANESKTSEGLAARVAAEGIKHLILVPAEAARLGPALGAFSDEGYRHWAALDPAFLKTAFKGPACVVFSLKEPRTP